MTLRFGFDFISPFAYIAWHALQPIAQRHGRTIEPFPVLLGPMLRHHGTLGPAEVPAKRRYLVHHLDRLSRQHGVPFGLPPLHPFNPLCALRVLCLDLQPDERAQLVTALFQETWGPGARGVQDHAVVGTICAQHGVVDAVERIQRAEIKQRLRTNTETAIADGAFGVPTVWADGEMFWGVDSLPHLDRFLETGERTRPELVQAWDHLPQHHRPGVPASARPAPDEAGGA